MANLVFYDQTHQYTVDGVEVPSVSELTRFISREVYKDVQQFMLDAAATRGTNVHKATEALDKFGTVEVDDEALPYIKAYLKFRKDHQPDWIKVEWSVNRGFLYAGTLDRYGTIGDKKVILDIKTTSRISKDHKVLYTAAQNLYRMAIEQDYPVDAIYILQLKKDGTYKFYELEIQDELANACITMHQALIKTKKKKGDTETDDQD